MLEARREAAACIAPADARRLRRAMTGTNGVAVIGAGAWGTAIAQVLAAAGRDVALWARRADVVDAIMRAAENTPCLPGVRLAPSLRASTDLAATLAGRHAAVLAVPTQFCAEVAARMRDAGFAGDTILAAKGFERATGRLPTEAVAVALPRAPLAVLSGPGFARDLAAGLPTAIVLAAPEMERARRLAAAMATPRLRVYASDDPVGVQVGGALKNVVAIACGIVMGRGLGESARAALLTRGLAEMARLGEALGGRRETLMGLSGLGDLALTCSSAQSRNFALGLELGRGATLAALLRDRRSVVEGVATAAAVAALARARAIPMPIAEAVDAILHRGAAIDDTIAALMARPLREEG